MSHQPEEVLKNISSYLKSKHISQLDASRLLGYGSKQTFCNVLSGRKYLSKAQAMRFAFIFPFDINYLTTGEGELLKKEAQLTDEEQDKLNTEQGQTEGVSAIRIVNLLQYLAVCLQDKDILNFSENIHKLVFFSDIEGKRVIGDNAAEENGAEGFIKARITNTELKIKESLAIIREKFPYGITPAEKH